MCPQVGVYPRVVPGVHDHETVNQGGRLNYIDVLTNKPFIDDREYPTLQAALDAVTDNSKLVISQRHVLTAELLLSNVNNVFIQFTNEGLIDASGLGGSTTALTISGTQTGVTSNLSGNASRGEEIISVVNGGLFAVGDMVLLDSNGLWSSIAGNIERGELQMIKSIAGNNITFYSGIFDDYAIADTAKITRIEPCNNLIVENPKIIGCHDSDWGIDFRYIKNLYVENPIIESCEERGMLLGYVYKAKVESGEIINSDKAGLGYGISVAYASQFIDINKTFIKDCRNAVDFGGGGGNSGLPRFCKVKNCKSLDMLLNGFNCHDVADYITYEDNEVWNPGQNGIGGACPNFEVLNNKIFNSGAHAIGANNNSLQARGVLKIEGNRLIDCDNGLQTISANPGVSILDSIIIKDNFINTQGTRGIEIFVDSGKFIFNVEIVGNKLYRVSGFETIKVRGLDLNSIKRLTISHNKFKPLEGNVRTPIYVENVDMLEIQSNEIDFGGSVVNSIIQVVDSQKLNISSNNIDAPDASNGIRCEGCIDGIVEGNTVMIDDAGVPIYIDTLGVKAKDNKTQDPVNIVSAANITLPNDGEYFYIIGDTNITSITPSWKGREVTLLSNGGFSIVDGGNLRLNGAYGTTIDDTLRIVCNGTNWYEVSRSAN